MMCNNIKYLQVLEMSNGDVICCGKAIGTSKDFKNYLMLPLQTLEYILKSKNEKNK